MCLTPCAPCIFIPRLWGPTQHKQVHETNSLTGPNIGVNSIPERPAIAMAAKRFVDII